eukprot:TRINITY_DN7345_c0_g2_i2.p1 TRINITY_DN7345_c0_g2~~TRINITY_DN7345_c0_g2_i2.p1  ORF type:complete len:924 (-),score=240.15 TRINITY_DN7345_c0_g2_i2:191-2962(-)
MIIKQWYQRRVRGPISLPSCITTCLYTAFHCHTSSFIYLLFILLLYAFMGNVVQKGKVLTSNNNASSSSTPSSQSPSLDPKNTASKIFTNSINNARQTVSVVLKWDANSQQPTLPTTEKFTIQTHENETVEEFLQEIKGSKFMPPNWKLTGVYKDGVKLRTKTGSPQALKVSDVNSYDAPLSISKHTSFPKYYSRYLHQQHPNTQRRLIVKISSIENCQDCLVFGKEREGLYTKFDVNLHKVSDFVSGREGIIPSEWIKESGIFANVQDGETVNPVLYPNIDAPTMAIQVHSASSSPSLYMSSLNSSSSLVMAPPENLCVCPPNHSVNKMLTDENSDPESQLKKLQAGGVFQFYVTPQLRQDVCFSKKEDVRPSLVGEWLNDFDTTPSSIGLNNGDVVYMHTLWSEPLVEILLDDYHIEDGDVLTVCASLKTNESPILIFLELYSADVLECVGNFTVNVTLSNTLSFVSQKIRTILGYSKVILFFGEKEAKEDKTFLELNIIEGDILRAAVSGKKDVKAKPRIPRSRVSKASTTLISYLSTNALQTEGITRISGNVNKVKMLKQNLIDRAENLLDSANEQSAPKTGFDKPPQTIDDVLQSNDTHTVAGALKLILRDMNEPLLTYSLYPQFLKVQGIENVEEKLHTIKNLLKRVLPENHGILRELLFFLHSVSLHSETNKMTTVNLAIVFAPTLLKREVVEGVDMEVITKEASQSIDIIKLMIEEYNFLFGEDKKEKSPGFWDFARSARVCVRFLDNEFYQKITGSTAKLPQQVRKQSQSDLHETQSTESQNEEESFPVNKVVTKGQDEDIEEIQQETTQSESAANLKPTKIDRPKKGDWEVVQNKDGNEGDEEENEREEEKAPPVVEKESEDDMDYNQDEDEMRMSNTVKALTVQELQTLKAKGKDRYGNSNTNDEDEISDVE